MSWGAVAAPDLRHRPPAPNSGTELRHRTPAPDTAKLIDAMIAGALAVTRPLHPLDRRARGEAFRRADVSRSVASASRPVVHLRGAATEARAGRRVVGRRQARRVRAVLRTAALPAGAAHRREPAGGNDEAPRPSSTSGAALARPARRGRARARSVPRVIGIDRHPWALAEAAGTYRSFGIAATVRQGDIATAMLPKAPAAILAAFTVNELADPARDALLPRLLERARQRRSRPRRRAARGIRRPMVEEVAGRVRVGRRPR